ncbi:hypothetical protein [Mycetocola sp.]
MNTASRLQTSAEPFSGLAARIIAIAAVSLVVLVALPLVIPERSPK